MAQISRPFQVAIGVFLLVAAAWFIALRPKGSSEPSKAATPHVASATQHISAPGVQGLVNDVNKAKGAVATSERNAKELRQRSEAASSPTGGTVAQTANTSTRTSTSHASAPAKAASKPAATKAAAAPDVDTPTRTSIHAYAGAGRKPARQVLVERALSEGKPAVILLWNKKGSDDRAVKFELEVLEFAHHVIGKLPKSSRLVHQLKADHVYLGRFAAFFSESKSVAEYGSITRGIQVYGTPTVIVVATNHKAKVLTGLTDAFAMQQAIEEARGAS